MLINYLFVVGKCVKYIPRVFAFSRLINEAFVVQLHFELKDVYLSFYWDEKDRSQMLCNLSEAFYTA